MAKQRRMKTADLGGMLLGGALLVGILSAWRGPDPEPPLAGAAELEALRYDWRPGAIAPGRWSPVDAPVAAPEAGETQALIEALESLGYLSGYDAAGVAGAVEMHPPEATRPGLNLVVSGHGEEALLLDMAGEVVHRWAVDTEALLPLMDVPRDVVRRGYLRRVRVMEDGGILAIIEGLALVRLDKDSRPLWAYPGSAHHDLDVDAAGRIFVLTREPRYHLPDAGLYPYLHDTITVLSPEGAPLRRLDLHGAVMDSPLRGAVQRSSDSRDPLHTNTLEIVGDALAASHPEAQPGQLLLSFRSISALGILDPETGALVWTRQGIFRFQHQPTSQGDGSLLLFDNQGAGGDARILSLGPGDAEARVLYGERPGETLRSARWGSVQPLPGGNILITESERGRAFEITPEGEIVWSYRSPYRAGEGDAYVATLIELVRLPEGTGAGWLEGEGEGGSLEL